MGLLAAVGMVAFNHVQAKARDAKREADLEAIATAMELSMTTENSYPDTTSNTYCLEDICNGSTPTLCTEFQTYMPDIPSDPLNGSSNDQCYLFSSDGSNYRVATQLEKNDSRMSSDSGIYLYFMERASDFTAITLSDWTDVWQGDLGGFVSYLDDYLVGRWSLSEDDQVREGVWFDGGDDYINLGSLSDNAISSSTGISVSAWFKTTSTSGYINIFSGWGAHYDVRFNSGLISANFQGGGSGGQQYSGYNDGGWHQIIATHDGTNVRIYIDSDLQSGCPYVEVISDRNTGNSSIGAHANFADNFFSGQISDVRVWNRAINDTEVDTIYANGDISSGLIGHWFLDDETGTIATDSAGSSNGTLTGGPFWSKDISDLSSNSNNGAVYGAAYADGQDASVNGALDFAGANDDYVDCGDISSSDWTGLTVTAWVKWDGTVDNSYATVYAKSMSSDIGRILINTSGKFLVQNGNGVFWSDNNGDITIDDWEFITYKYDQSAEMEYLYVDNSLVGSQSRTGDLTQNSSSFFIGASGGPGSNYSYFGNISDVRVYDRALTTDEIMSIYMGTD